MFLYPFTESEFFYLIFVKPKNLGSDDSDELASSIIQSVLENIVKAFVLSVN